MGDCFIDPFIWIMPDTAEMSLWSPQESQLEEIFFSNACMTKKKIYAPAMELASLGLGSLAQINGCVIVHSDQIIGEGYHEEYGKAHADNAITSVQNPICF